MNLATLKAALAWLDENGWTEDKCSLTVDCVNGYYTVTARVQGHEPLYYQGKEFDGCVLARYPMEKA